jgi:flagellar motor switch protein FliG
VAALLLSIDQELSAKVLKHFTEDTIDKVTRAMQELQEIVIDQDTVRRVHTSAVQRMRQGGLALGDVASAMKNVLVKAFGQDKGVDVTRRANSDILAKRPFAMFEALTAEDLANLLTEEHPQIAAVVLTQLPASVAAKVLQLMPPEAGADLTARIAELEEVPEHAVAEASESLVRALEIAGGLANSDQRSEFDGLAFSAAIVNELSTEAGDDLLGKIAERDETVATRIREAMFTFEDLQRIAVRELGNLMRSVQSETLVTALQTATAELRDHLLASLSQRASATLRDDLAAASPKRLSEVEAAQREVVDAAMKLAGEGKITMPSRGGE